MAQPAGKPSVPVAPVRVALIVLFVAVLAIFGTAFVLSRMQPPREPEATGSDPELATTCGNACRGCASREYDARCFDRCRFGFKPYCD